jgi:hypothetical protein
MTAPKKAFPVLPPTLYLSLRTGEPVTVPSFAGWTDGDIRQWKSEHVRYDREAPAEKKRGPFTAALERDAAAAKQSLLERMAEIHRGKELLSSIGTTRPSTWDFRGTVRPLSSERVLDYRFPPESAGRALPDGSLPARALEAIAALGTSREIEASYSNAYPEMRCPEMAPLPRVPHGIGWLRSHLFGRILEAPTTEEREQLRAHLKKQHPSFGAAWYASLELYVFGAEKQKPLVGAIETTPATKAALQAIDDLGVWGGHGTW